MVLFPDWLLLVHQTERPEGLPTHTQEMKTKMTPWIAMTVTGTPDRVVKGETRVASKNFRVLPTPMSGRYLHIAENHDGPQDSLLIRPELGYELYRVLERYLEETGQLPKPGSTTAYEFNDLYAIRPAY